MYFSCRYSYIYITINNNDLFGIIK